MWYRIVTKGLPYILGGYFANDIIQFVNNVFGKSSSSGVGISGAAAPRPFSYLTLGFLVLGYLIFKELNK